MPYVLPTAADLKAAFPAFASVPDNTVNTNIARASRSVDTSWAEGDYADAISLLAAHYMASVGIGGTDNQQALSAVANLFSSVRSGQLNLTARDVKAGAQSVPDEWAGSAYGRQFWFLLKRNKGGPRVAAGGYVGDGHSLGHEYGYPYYGGLPW